MKKYELVCDSGVAAYGRIFYRIRALRDFGEVEKGQLGGHVESEKNLSHDGLCWIYDDATVCNHAQIIEDALVFDYADIRGNAIIGGEAVVKDHAIVDHRACIRDNVTISERARVFGDAIVRDYSKVGGRATVYDHAIVCGNAAVKEDADIHGNAIIESNAIVKGHAIILSDALIKSSFDYATISGFGHIGRNTTFFRLSNGDIGVKCGCFYGTLGEFRKKVVETHGNTHYAEEYLMIADLMKKHFMRESKSLKYSSPFI